MGDDTAMLEIVSSANIACGFHAGDPSGIYDTLQAAISKNVKIGAHISYPDKAGFGRRFIDISSKDLFAEVIYQISALDGMAKTLNGKVSYIKPHGALYNRMATDLEHAKVVLDALKAYNPKLKLLALANSALINFAKNLGVDVIAEAFADRAYTSKGHLVARNIKGALLHDVDKICARMIKLVKTGELESIEGKSIKIDASSICVHGDSPDAVAIAKAIAVAFKHEDISIKSFITT
ncbi:hypothetical protein BKH43_04575 [Helicobacter sp. 13S00401-1]|nr:hypothetical protein BKH43_04575 [Helicobacter sp. 13S00401-1]